MSLDVMQRVTLCPETKLMLGRHEVFRYKFMLTFVHRSPVREWNVTPNFTGMDLTKLGCEVYFLMYEHAFD